MIFPCLFQYFLFNFCTLLSNFEKLYFWMFLVTKLEKCWECQFAQNWLNLNRFWLILLRSLFFRWQNLTKCYVFWQNHDFRVSKFCVRVFKFVWRTPKVLWSFSRSNIRHALSNFTIRKISLPWYDFVKESSSNSPYRSPKRRNEIGTQNFVKFSRATN